MAKSIKGLYENGVLSRSPKCDLKTDKELS